MSYEFPLVDEVRTARVTTARRDGGGFATTVELRKLNMVALKDHKSDSEGAARVYHQFVVDLLKEMDEVFPLPKNR
jgi:hypothetical protein